MGHLVRWLGIMWISLILIMGLILSANRTGKAPRGWMLFSHCPSTTLCNIYRVQPDQKYMQTLAQRTYTPNQPYVRRLSPVRMNNGSILVALPGKTLIYIEYAPTV
jgi:hypothetical protein